MALRNTVLEGGALEARQEEVCSQAIWKLPKWCHYPQFYNEMQSHQVAQSKKNLIFLICIVIDNYSSVLGRYPSHSIKLLRPASFMQIWGMTRKRCQFPQFVVFKQWSRIFCISWNDIVQLWSHSLLKYFSHTSSSWLSLTPTVK